MKPIFSIQSLWKLVALSSLLLLALTPDRAVAQEVIGISAILGTTDSTHIDTYSATEMDASTAFYYDAYVEGFLFQNGSEIAAGAAQGNPTAAGGFTEPLTVGDTYEIDSYHFLVAFFAFTDATGTNFYSNPYDYLIDSGSSLDPNGTDFLSGGGPAFYDLQYLFLGATGVVLPTGMPSITSINPNSGPIPTSGTLTVRGSNLEDEFTQTTIPAITGSGMTLTVQSVTPTQVTLAYTIAQSASTGAHSITLATRFGTSNAAAFTVFDPTPVVNSISPSTWQAGTDVSITISGAGFGTNPSVTISGTGLSAGPITSAGDTAIAMTVSVAADAPDETATVQVQSHGYNGNGFLCNPSACSSQSSTGSNTANVNATPAPTPQIKFGRDTSVCSGSGTDITSTPQSIVMGQPLALVACVTLPANLSISNQNWSTPAGTAVGGYNASTSGGAVTPLPTTIGSTYLFYWADGAGNSRNMTYTYTMSNGRSNSATATFNIDGPTGVNVVTFPTPNTLAPVNVRNASLQGSQITFPVLQLGTGNSGAPATFGIVLQASASHLPAKVGWYEWVQLISTDHFQYLDSNSKRQSCLPNNWNNTPILDTVFPYSAGPANSQAGAVVGDSPDSPLAAESAQQFEATMYLMWDPAIPLDGQSSCNPAQVSSTTPPVATPSTCASIPVPLGVVKWRWSGDAVDTLSLASGDNGTTGHLLCGPEFVTSFLDSLTEGAIYPKWKNNIQSGQSLNQAFTCTVQ